MTQPTPSRFSALLIRCQDAGVHLTRALEAKDEARRLEELAISRRYLRKLWTALQAEVTKGHDCPNCGGGVDSGGERR